MTDILAVSLLPNFDRSHTQCNAYSLHLEQTILCRVNVRDYKEAYTKYKSEKNTRDKWITP